MDLLIVKKKYGSFDSFEGAKLANKCLPYDFVEFSENGCKLVKRTQHPTLVGILETTRSKYGYSSHGNPIYLCKPLDETYPPFYVGSKIQDKVINKLVLFKFDKWEKEFPNGALEEIIGDCGTYNVEKKAALIKASPYKWNKIVPSIIQPSFEGRTYIDGYTFNIDPDGCRDVDDCITIKDNKLIISIADVSAWVEMNPWMKYAEFIGTSLYENSGCVKPMFPKELSEDLMSLVENKERLAFSLIITFDETISYEFKETVVKVNKSHTYESIYQDEISSVLKEYIQKLLGTNNSHNSDLDDSHKWVEILMLYYNTKAGEVLKQKNKGILRAQKKKNLEYAKQFEMLDENYLYLTYESAKYCKPTDDTEHFMLNVQAYAHASSPIRRYVDIINQFALKDKNFSYECIDRFNKQQKAAKNFERDLLYISLYFNKKNIEGIVLDSQNIFIPLLKKIIHLENSFNKNEKVFLKYYMNPQTARWKERIIFQLNM